MRFPDRSLDLAGINLRVAKNSFKRVTLGVHSMGGMWPGSRVAGPQARLWATELETTAMSFAETQMLEARLDRLDGGAVALRLDDPMRPLPQGMAAGIWQGSPAGTYTIDGSYLIDGVWHVDGGSTFGRVAADAPRWANAIRLGGLTPSALVFRAGDLFETGGNLYQVADDAMADAAGEATVLFGWKLWKPALAGDIVNFKQAKGRFVLRDLDGWQSSRTGAGNIGTASLSAIELPVME